MPAAFAALRSPQISNRAVARSSSRREEPGRRVEAWRGFYPVASAAVGLVIVGCDVELAYFVRSAERLSGHPVDAVDERRGVADTKREFLARFDHHLFTGLEQPVDDAVAVGRGGNPDRS